MSSTSRRTLHTEAIEGSWALRTRTLVRTQIGHNGPKRWDLWSRLYRSEITENEDFLTSSEDESPIHTAAGYYTSMKEESGADIQLCLHRIKNQLHDINMHAFDNRIYIASVMDIIEQYLQ